MLFGTLQLEHGRGQSASVRIIVCVLVKLVTVASLALVIRKI
jgi:hypothetical protein